MSEIPNRKINKDNPKLLPNENKVYTKIGEALENNFEKMLDFITEKVKLTELKLLFDGEREPSLYELNKALAQHEHGRLGLILHYEAAAYDYDRAKAVFEEFWAEKVSQVREEYNKKEDPKSKWLSASEIEAIVRTRFKKEIALMNTDIIISERNKSTAYRILDGWQNYGWALQQLSKNSVAEVNAHLRSENNNLNEFNPND
jgi:hypothetical protein